MKILIVDDDPDFCESVRGILEGDGMEVVCAHSQREATRKLGAKGNGFEAALIDMYMEEPDSGLKLIKFIEKKRLPVVSVVVTGFGKVDNAVECMKAGAFDYIEKGRKEQTELIRLAVNKARDAYIARVCKNAVTHLRPHLKDLTGKLNEILDYLQRFVDEIPDIVATLKEHRGRGRRRKGP